MKILVPVTALFLVSGTIAECRESGVPTTRLTEPTPIASSTRVSTVAFGESQVGDKKGKRAKARKGVRGLRGKKGVKRPFKGKMKRGRDLRRGETRRPGLRHEKRGSQSRRGFQRPSSGERQRGSGRWDRRGFRNGLEGKARDRGWRRSQDKGRRDTPFKGRKRLRRHRGE